MASDNFNPTVKQIIYRSFVKYDTGSNCVKYIYKEKKNKFNI